MKNPAKLLALALLFTTTIGRAAQLEGVTLPDKTTVAGKDLLLNGIGLRTATIFGVKVYVGGLYLAAKSKEPKAILESTTPKQVRLHFVREVDAEKIAGAWDESMKAVKDKYAADVTKLKGLMPKVASGDSMTYTFLPDGVEVSVNDKPKGKLPGGDFAKTMLASWIGENPPTKELKKGMLGE